MATQSITKTSTTTIEKETPRANKIELKQIKNDDFSVATKLLSVLVWVAIVIVPVTLTFNDTYKQVFPEEWYSFDPESADMPKKTGLLLGIGTVAVGQVFMIIYHWMNRNGFFGAPKVIQLGPELDYGFGEGIFTHLYQPAGFGFLAAYLAGTWLFRLMPDSYYSFEGGIQWGSVVACLIFQDGVQAAIHYGEHMATAWYKVSHKPHHKWKNPRLFDAYNASPTDTFAMVLIPLFITGQVFHLNAWSYMAFGSLFSNWLTLIHSEFAHPWEGVFKAVGLGTAADHHVHHKLFNYNFGHLFMWWDMMGGTYKDPVDCTKYFRSGTI